MTFTNSYPTGTLVTFYASSDRKPAAASCRAIMAAGPVNKSEYLMGATTYAALSAFDGDTDFYLVAIGERQCVVPMLPDGIETGQAVRYEDAHHDGYGIVVAGPMEAHDTMFDMCVRYEGINGVFDMLCDLSDVTEVHGCECGNLFTLCHPDA